MVVVIMNDWEDERDFCSEKLVQTKMIRAEGSVVALFCTKVTLFSVSLARRFL
jgi:hypothetical protein